LSRHEGRKTRVTTVYDAMAPDFDRRRALPDGVPETIRAAILDAIGDAAAPGPPRIPRPRILDLGAGSGRIGRAFVRAGDDYTGADLSFGMLQTFAATAPATATAPRLAQADASHLPFAAATFDAVLLVQVLSRTSDWRALLSDAIRVLRPDGTLIIGRVAAPDDGVDARMKSRLAAILAEMGIHPYRDQFRDEALSWLAGRIPSPVTVTAATWTAERRPDAFLERHAAGARLAALDEATTQEAMRRLADWAAQAFGDLGIAMSERYKFEIIIHRMQGTALNHA
jgi:ubiquinone/menaquinone biosynthesis C-methylase UbiE